MRVWLRFLIILLAASVMALECGRSHAADQPDPAAIMKRLEETKAKYRDEIKAKLAELHIEPRTVETLPEEGVRIRNLIRRGDFAAARQTLADTRAHSELTPWSFYPFTGVLEWTPVAHDPDLAKRLDEWVGKAPDDPLPLLVRAQMYLYATGSARGENFANQTSADRLKTAAGYRAKAIADVDAAIKRDPAIPYAYVLKLKILASGGFSADLAAASTDAIAKYPDYFSLYKITLETLEPKWGGSVQAMYRFVDYYAGKRPADSPLKLLYLFLYAHLLDDASVSCYDQYPDTDKVVRCIVTYMDDNVTADLQKQAVAAFKLYDRPDYRSVGYRVRDAFLEMMNIRAGAAYYKAMLENAAEAMNSDTSLNDKPGGHGYYIIDELVAESYADASQIAIKKLAHASHDIENTPFPDEIDRYQEKSWIYDKIANLYQSMLPNPGCSDIANPLFCNKEYTIAYETAARMLNKSTEHETLACAEYGSIFRLFEEAVKECSDIIDYDNNISAHALRGNAYMMLHQWENAVRDFTAVVEAESNQPMQRLSAEMEIAMVYAFQRDYQSELKTYAKYPDLFDPDIAGAAFVFTSYNNRCSAYKNIGELQRALADCTEALKYNWAETTYQLQQELQQKLNKH